MDKSSAPLGVNPVGKVSALTAVASVASNAQSLESRASHQAHQQAALTAQLASGAGHQALQKLISTADVSATAHFIDQALKQAKATGVSETYVAQTVLTQTPQLPKVVANQLRTAIANSGLFYEAHLNEFAEGQRSLEALKQEPQNKPNQLMQSLLPQQLHILEQQRLSWHGEVWSNQLMDWEIYLQQHQEDKQAANQSNEAPETVVSHLTLDLPRLGKVTANITLQNGRLRIGFLTAGKAALQELKAQSQTLVSAIEGNGQTVEQLSVKEAEEVTL